MKVNEEKSKLAIDYINKNYSIKDFLVSKGLMDSNFEYGKIACLKHNDKTPSMDVDIRNNRFKCHSCGAGGNYVSMIVHYNEAILGNKSNYFRIIDDIIKRDIRARNQLGFITIFEEERNIELNIGVRKFNIRPRYTFLMLSKDIKNLSIEEKLMAVNLAQNGFTPEEIKKNLFKEIEEKDDEISLLDFQEDEESSERILDLFN